MEEKFLCMKVSDAYEESKSSALADKIWKCKHDGKVCDKADSEYKSWIESPIKFLEAVKQAGLENLEVAFEFPTPSGNYIDYILLGKSKDAKESEFGRILIVEINGWEKVSPTDNGNTIKTQGDKLRDHPVFQVKNYEAQMSKHHHGILEKSGSIAIDSLVFMYNFPSDSKSSLFSGKYEEWTDFVNKTYVKDEDKKLVSYLSDSFSTESNPDLYEVLKNDAHVLGKAGLDGLRKAFNMKENAKVIDDQKEVVDFVKGRITELQKMKASEKEKHKEIIVVSGAPGTGKTIVGMHFIYDYADIFGPKEVKTKASFCLPKSRTVKTIIDKVCEANVTSFLDNLDWDQDVVVVDEAHRISNLNTTLDIVFAKRTKILILLQDDHQIIRPGEEGTWKNIENYAKAKGIKIADQQKLTTQRRCSSLGNLLGGLNKLFYGEGDFDGQSITSVEVFNKLQELDNWVEKKAEKGRAKLVAPYCWKWNGGKDVQIYDNGTLFQKAWNPGNLQEQAKWYLNTNTAGQIASIYTSQGLDFDDIGFIWWDDLKWNEEKNEWESDINKSMDGAFVSGVRRLGTKKEDIDNLFKNTYYVMLSRARNKMGIWFKDLATKRHVSSVLGLKEYSSSDSKFLEEDAETTAIKAEEPEERLPLYIGNAKTHIYHRFGSKCPYLPDAGAEIKFYSVEEAKSARFYPCYTCRP